MLLTARLASLFAASSLFMLQPLVARALVPLYGGTSWVWIAVSVFFQLALIIGYVCATKLGGPGRARWHARLAPAALLFAFAGFWVLLQRITFEPLPIEVAVFVHLLLTVGVVAVYLAMAAPLLQIAIESDGRIDAHRLYAWSNAGSLAGLILYPTVMESFVPLPYQMGIWLALAVAATLMMHRTVSHAQASAGPQQIDWRFPGRGRVMFISAAAGALTIAVTARLTLDLGALPLLWVLPLIVLLLSFIVAFGDLRFQRGLLLAAPIAVAISCYLLANTIGLAPLQLVMLWCVLLFVIQCGLQGRLRALAPTGSARGAYYVALAVGGFAGSLLAGCVVPYSWNALAAIAAMPVTAPVLQPLLRNDPTPELGWCLVAAAFALVHRERWGRGDWFGVAIALAVVAKSLVPNPFGFELARTRNVYGVLTTQSTPDGRFTMLLHGSTLHGLQMSERSPAGQVVPRAPQQPLTYYHASSPIGEVFRAFYARKCALRVGLVGLGAGTLAAYARPGDDFEYYEIDPGVITTAEGPYFSYLAAARQRGARVTIVEGDGRQTLARRSGPKLDLIVFDAFSSDSIPTHLLTLEAFRFAYDQLVPGGVIAFHTSNRSFAVERVVMANAERLGWTHNLRSGQVTAGGTLVSTWVIVKPDAAVQGPCVLNTEQGPRATVTTAAWTDNLANQLSVLKGAGLWSQLTGAPSAPAAAEPTAR